jgi:hypothetical protein
MAPEAKECADLRNDGASAEEMKIKPAQGKWPSRPGVLQLGMPGYDHSIIQMHPYGELGI